MSEYNLQKALYYIIKSQFLSHMNVGESLANILENLSMKKILEKKDSMIEKACQKLAKSYKKYAEKPNEKLFDPKNWKEKLA